VKSRSNFIRFLGFLKPHRWRFAGLVAFSALFAVTGIPALLLARRILADTPDLVKDGNYAEAFHVGLICIGGSIAIQVLDLSLGFLRTMLMIRIGERLVFDIRQKLYRHIQRLSLRYYEGVQTGGIMSRVLWDVEGIRQVSTGSLSQFIVDMVVLVVYTIYLFVTRWQVGILALIFLPLYLLNYLIFRSKIRDASIEVRDKFTAITTDLHERVAGVRVVKSFGTERSEARAFVSEARENLTLSLRLGTWSAAFGHTAALITIVGTQLVSLFVIFNACQPDATMKVADLVLYQGLLGRMYGPIINMTNLNDAIMRASACIDRIFATLDSIPDVEEAPDAVTPAEVRGEVAFDGVYFAYEPDELVLKNVSLVAKPGTVTAVVGPSGGGKSTLINLIPRFYDPIGGSVTLDGIDLRRLKLAALRSHIGIVLQDTYLFSGTIRENIMYGRSGATEAEVEAAARAANAHDFILEFRDGYDEEVGERGNKLSGGQKQRIAIARAILRNPRILILDEATSALDSESEHLIQQALENLMENRTTFAIAHRLSTVMNADQILVIENGEVIERGRHAELVLQGGRYAHLAEIQFKAPTLADEEARYRLEQGSDESREDRDSDGY
jgi:ATP-binding cassette, subfamily B, bacterial MsbA